MTNQVTAFTNSWWLATVHLLSSHTDNRVCHCAVSSSPRELVNKDESAAKKLKAILLEVQSESNAGGVTEKLLMREQGHCRRCSRESGCATQGTQWRKFISITERRGCDRKGEFASETVTPAQYCTFKEFSEILHNTESTKDKVLEADPDLENSRTSGRAWRWCPLCIVSDMTRRRQALLKLIQIKFFFYQK